jgi:hypothetical protein
MFWIEKHHPRPYRCGCDAGEVDQRYRCQAAFHLCDRNRRVDLLQLVKLAYSIFSQHSGREETAARLRGKSCVSWLCFSAAFFSPLMFIINISSTEVFFKASGIPVSEQPNLVGQRSTVLEAGLVIVATAINKWVSHRQKKREKSNVVTDEHGLTDSVQMVNNGKYKWEPGNYTDSRQGLDRTIQV